MRYLVILLVALGLAGCASTRIVSEWVDADYGAPRFRRILVIGISEQPSVRRSFEDRFVARLKAEGVDAAPSYRYIPEGGRVDEARLQEAVRQAEADAAIITRLVRVETKTAVSPGMYHAVPPLGHRFYRGYSFAWLGYYDPPRVHQYDVYVSETSLYDTTGNRLVWSGLAQTRASGDIDRAIARYVDTVVETLARNRLLPSVAAQGSWTAARTGGTAASRRGGD